MHLSDCYPKQHPACKRLPTPAQAAASELRAADPKEDTPKPKEQLTCTCQTVTTKKNIPPANANQIQPNLPHQSCALRIPNKTPQTRTCHNVTPKNIQHANADQLRSKLPNQTCALRIPNKTP